MGAVEEAVDSHLLEVSRVRTGRHFRFQKGGNIRPFPPPPGLCHWLDAARGEEREAQAEMSVRGLLVVVGQRPFNASVMCCIGMRETV